MGQPALLVENVFSSVQFPAHTLSGNEEPAGHEAWRVADGRRSSLDYWQPSTTNAIAWLKSRGNRLRTVNMLALDRGHNLGGFVVQLHASGDDFTTYTTVFSVTVPTASGPGALDDPVGARTPEGAWLIRFDAVAAYDYRLYIPAMGSALAPIVVGLWLGLAWAPPLPELPLGIGQQDLVGPSQTSAVGWLARGQSTQQRAGELRLRLDDTFAEEVARYHLEGHYAAGRPMWIVADDEEADRAFLALRPGGRFGLRRESRWYYPRVDVPYVEHQPLLVGQ